MNGDNDIEIGSESPYSFVHMWTCLSTTHQSIWKIDIIGMFVPVLAREELKGLCLGTGKRFHEEDGKIQYLH